MHRDKMKEKKKKRKSKKNKKRDSDSSDSEDEEKKKEKLKKVKTYVSQIASRVYLYVSNLIIFCNHPATSFFLLGTRSRGQAGEACRSNNAAGWEEEAVQQPAGSKGAHWGGDGGLPHETLPARWSHGFLPGTVTLSYPCWTLSYSPRDSAKAAARWRKKISNSQNWSLVLYINS